MNDDTIPVDQVSRRSDMRIHLLGHIRVIDEDNEVALSPQQRALLAVLLLSPERAITREHVMRWMWPGGGDRSDALRQCVTGLRKRLPVLLPKGNEPGLIRTVVARQDVDLFRFRDGVQKAGEQRGTVRLQSLRAALAEWHGEPLGGAPGGALLEKKQELTKERIGATRDYLHILLKTDQEEFRRDLRRARGRWPADPSLFDIELRARFSDGDPKVRQFYANWTGEFGRPLPSTQRLFQERTRGSVPGSVRRPVPQQLPPFRPTLIGREAPLNRLDQALLADSSGTARAAVVSGLPGIGKTQLVVHWAWRNAVAFPDGTLYANLNGFGAREAPERPAQVLARLLNDLGVEPSAPTLDGMVTAYRTALYARRILVVLDNACDANQIRPLLPGNGTCAVVVTSRDRLDGLQVHEHLQEIRLGPLSDAEARELLIEDLGAARVKGGESHVGEIVAMCGGLPLALSVVAAQVRARPWERLAGIALSLRDEHNRLAALRDRTGEFDVKAALTMSYNRLSVDAKGLLARLGLHPGPTIGWKAVVALFPDRSRAVRATEELVGNSLLDDVAPDRFALHDLVRLFASECGQNLPTAHQADATHRVMRYLLHNSLVCDRVLSPERPLPLDYPNSAEIAAQATVGQVMTWLDAEYATITAGILLAHRLSLDEYTWPLALALVTYQWRTGRYADAECYLRYAVEAADRCAVPAIQATIRRSLGGSLRGLGEWAHARDEITIAVGLAEEGRDDLGIALGRQRLALLHRELGELQAATEQFTLALAGFRKLGVGDGEAHSLAGLADVRRDAGDIKAALEFGEAALALFSSGSDPNGYASTIADLGRAHAAGNDRIRAIAHFKDAVVRYRDLQYSSREARTLVELADLQIDIYALDEARESLLLARQLYHYLADSVGTDAVDARLEELNA